MLADFRRRLGESVEYLTVIRFRRGASIWREDEIGRYPGYFPLVGLLLGLILFGARHLLNVILPDRLTALLLTLLLIVLTRGFHQDGLADMADAVLSHRSRERMLEIMKDSHQGTFGVLALIFTVLLKVELIVLMAAHPTGLILFPLWGRLATSLVAVRSVYVGSQNGLGRFLVEESNSYDLALALASSLIFSVLIGGLPGFMTFLGVAAFGLTLIWLWRRVLGGVTGDLLGASLELTELFSLLLFFAFFKLVAG